ncbi:hypothetical protein GCM10027570_14850 [Streptomonospora sediminis]
MNLYIHETKGNAAYGDESGAIGAFYVVVRTNLNGRSPRLQASYVWDLGPALNFQVAVVQCYKEITLLPDSSCGTWPADGNDGSFVVSKDNFRFQGPLLHVEPLQDNGLYYAAANALVIPENNAAPLGMPTLETERWSCPSDGRRCFFP